MEQGGRREEGGDGGGWESTQDWRERCVGSDQLEEIGRVFAEVKDCEKGQSNDLTFDGIPLIDSR